MWDEGIEETEICSLDLVALGGWARARQLVDQVHRGHPKKNRNKTDCENED